MGKRGPKPKQLVDTTWTPNLAYAVGLLASDGCLATKQPIIDFTSADLEQIENYRACLNLFRLKVGIKSSGAGKWACRVQLHNPIFHKWLQDIGINPHKSKTLGPINVPGAYFFDFLRGSFDGDGSIHSYWDKRWKSSFMFYTIFASASRDHINWLRDEIDKRLGIRGHVTGGVRVSTLQLKYAKRDSLMLLGKMYPTENVVCLSRKKLKIEYILGIVGESLFKGEVKT